MNNTDNNIPDLNQINTLITQQIENSIYRERMEKKDRIVYKPVREIYYKLSACKIVKKYKQSILLKILALILVGWAFNLSQHVFNILFIVVFAIFMFLRAAFYTDHPDFKNYRHNQEKKD
jgi:hypothetical protein